MPKVTLTTNQILELCKFAGIAVEIKDSCFAEDIDQLETEFVISQDNFGIISYLQEYPEEGGYPLSGGDWKLFCCDQETGNEGLIDLGAEAYIRDQLKRNADRGRDVWLIRPDGQKELPLKDNP